MVKKLMLAFVVLRRWPVDPSGLRQHGQEDRKDDHNDGRNQQGSQGKGSPKKP